MKNIYLLSLLSLPAITLAQPVINSSNFTPAGQTSIRWIELEYVDISSASGANQTWDFSDLEPAGTEENLEFISAEGTPYEDEFPSANYAWTMETMAYFYHNISGTKWDELGFAVEEDKENIMMTYSNPRTILSFPLAYNSSHTDTYAGTLSGFGFQTDISGDYSYVIDGYGTLILPTGTVSNVLRVKVDYEETSSFMGQVGQVETTTLYQFYVNGLPYPIAATQYTEYVFEGETEIESYTYYTDETVSAVDENVQNLEVSLWPNPAADVVNVSMNQANSGNLEVRILDINGKLVKQELLPRAGNQFRMSTNELSPGFYTLQVIQPGSTSSTKLVIE